MKVLVIDNYDSFVYNLVQYLTELGCQVVVRKNGEIELNEAALFQKILISPGPGLPSEAGKVMEIIEQLAPSKSILGVCLGHQAIGELFGAELSQLQKVNHGVASLAQIVDKDEKLFEGLPSRIEVGLYHSWTVSKHNFPNQLKITSIDSYGNVLSLCHKNYDVRGVQFHPESVMTTYGKQIMKNWIKS